MSIRLDDDDKAAAEAVANLWRSAVGNEADCAVVFLHGHGESEVAYMEIFSSVTLPPEAGRCRWLWPRAELQPCSTRGGALTSQWFDTPEFPVCGVVRSVPDRPRLQEEPAEVQKAIRRIRAAVGALEEEGVPLNRIVLGGFGQGAALAIKTVLMAERPFAGCLLCSGWIPNEEEVMELMTDYGRTTPVLWCHGARDAVVEPRYAATQAKTLKEAGVPLQFKLFPELMFGISREVVASVQTWLGERLSPPIKPGSGGNDQGELNEDVVEGS
eukprot:TRINITY_DN12444_c0_g1_i1.p1 TRINITY_DN12444_c0_g1~~TRINITY_DN12444_c0_g1_i1.p1  ORF type:complete len:271 (+),score=47.14 TRINITY_DN12444_c0_g1_i1:120-932(+)